MKTMMMVLASVLTVSTTFAASAPVSPSARASDARITKADLLEVVNGDSVGRAALQQLKGANCRIDVKQAPAAPYEDFVLSGSCEQPADEVTGGGVYLMIVISGQYWNQGEGELRKVELGHAG